MDNISKTARALASYLIEVQDDFISLLDDHGFFINEDELAQSIDEYFNSRQ